MKSPRILALLLTAALLSGLLSGCAGNSVTATTPSSKQEASTAASEPSQTTPLTTKAETTTAETTEPETEEIPVRWQNGGELSFLPKEALTIPKLSEMQCERVDTEPLFAKIEALIEKAATCEDAEALLNDFYELYTELYHYWTMSTLSYIRFTQNYADEEANALMDYFTESDAIISEQLDVLFATMAQNPCRTDLEQAYFGEGFFEYYDDYNAVSDTYYNLIMQEDALLNQYYDLAADGIDMYSDYEVNKVHDDLARVFVEMVKVRNQIAAEKGYENYMEYLYPTHYDRDYTPAQAREFLNQVQVCLVPLAEYDALWNCEPANWYLPSGKQALEELSHVAQQLGGSIWEAFRFMTAYELYDVASSSRKMRCAYMIYICDYQAPAIIINPEGSSYTTLSHEFGHFVDRYCNYGDGSNIDIAEIYSQVMEYLYLVHDNAAEKTREQNIRALLADTLTYSIFRECAYADFELQVYSLAPEEITAEKIDAIFYQCMKTYGISRGAENSRMGKRWVAYHHFFDRAGYVISYATSAVAALEICAMDAAEPGAGLEAFNRLLNRTHGKKFLYMLNEAGLDNPFEAETLHKTAEFFKKSFELD